MACEMLLPVHRSCTNTIDYNFGLLDKAGSKLEDVMGINVSNGTVNGASEIYR